MKVVFYASAKPREHMIAEAFKRGVLARGDQFELRATGDYGEDDQGNYRKFAGPTDDTDVAVFFGVKGVSSELMKDHLQMGRHTVFLDKGYTREKGENGHTLYTRVSIDAGSPIDYMMERGYKDERLKALRIKLAPRRDTTSGHILYASSSQKYNDFFGLGESSECAYRVFKRLEKWTRRQMIYRPKPSDKRAKPIPGIALSPNSQSMRMALMGCHALITYGSTAAMDAVIAGVPAIVLGDAIAAPVAQRFLDLPEHVETPYWPNDNERLAWMRAVSYQQWTLPEFRNGEAWEYIRDWLPAVKEVQQKTQAKHAAQKQAVADLVTERELEAAQKRQRDKQTPRT